MDRSSVLRSRSAVISRPLPYQSLQTLNLTHAGDAHDQLQVIDEVRKVQVCEVNGISSISYAIPCCFKVFQNDSYAGFIMSNHSSRDTSHQACVKSSLIYIVICMLGSKGTLHCSFGAHSPR